jgi:hypothetical protein
VNTSGQPCCNFFNVVFGAAFLASVALLANTVSNWLGIEFIFAFCGIFIVIVVTIFATYYYTMEYNIPGCRSGCCEKLCSARAWRLQSKVAAPDGDIYESNCGKYYTKQGSKIFEVDGSDGVLVPYMERRFLFGRWVEVTAIPRPSLTASAETPTRTDSREP